MDTSEFYDPLGDAPAAAFADVGDRFTGLVAKAEWADDKYGTDKVPAITLHLDKPLEDDEYVRVFVRSKQMQRALGRAVRHCGRTSVTEGDWISVEYVEEAESTSGNSYKVYDVEYRTGEDSSEPSIGTGEFIDGASQPSLLDPPGDEPF
jgi:hypothetical protein